MVGELVLRMELLKEKAMIDISLACQFSSHPFPIIIIESKFNHDVSATFCFDTTIQHADFGVFVVEFFCNLRELT